MKIDSAFELQFEVMRSVFDYTELPTIQTVADDADGAPRLPRMVDLRALEAERKHLPYRTHFMGIAFAVGTVPSRGINQARMLVLCQDRRLVRSSIVDGIVAKAPREVSVVYTGRARQQAAASAAPKIGDSIGHRGVTAGTLGRFVRHAQTGDIGVLSNNHILAATNAAKIGDEILHPGRADSGTDHFPHLAAFQRLELGVGSVNYSDAAWARVIPELTKNLENTIQDRNGEHSNLRQQIRSDVLPDVPVRKIGRTTKHTSGLVVAVGVNHLWVGMSSQGFDSVARFDDQIVIQGAGEGAFSKGGDSGSVVFDDECHPLALLFAGTEKGGENGRGLTYASPIGTVLAGLGLDILSG